MANDKMFTTATDFSQHIEHLVVKNKTTHMQAVLDYCEQNFIEPKDIVHLINRQLRTKIKIDATNLNFFPKKSKLTI